MGGPQGSHLGAVVYVLLWVSLHGIASLAGLEMLNFDLNVCRWLAWACDAIDFFSVSLNIVNLQAQFGRSTHAIVSYIPETSYYILLSFLLGPDDIYHPHAVVPFHWRCK
jgi:hypothetical protein